MAVEGYIIATDGKQQCPTDICNAVCCRATSFRADKPGPCEYLDQDRNLCTLHSIGGQICKPYGCYVYPRNQMDIDVVNQQAELAGLSERCQLKVV